jgi:hypothetical protein
MSGQNPLPNIGENSQDMINDIQSLQTMEQQLFNSLETNPNLTPEQKQQIVDKIDKLSQMRINLYQTMGGVNSFFQHALSSSQGTLQEQTSAIQIIEDELNKSKSNLATLQEEKNNKLRLVEINNYFGDKYAEHADLMKIIIFTLVPVIILAILNSKGYLPNTIYYILIAIIALIGGIFFWRRFFSIISRNNMEYKSYDFYFDASGGDVSNSSDNSLETGFANDPWASKNNNDPLTCIGQECCAGGLVWDSSNNQCIVDVSVPTNNKNQIESFITESMVNSILTKNSTTNKYKQGFKNNQFNPKMSDSFINYKI